MLVIAHRGASADLPENTLPAFERAIQVGADFVELDVHNDLEVTHDKPVRGIVYPTLAEVLDLCHGRSRRHGRAEAPPGRDRSARPRPDARR